MRRQHSKTDKRKALLPALAFAALLVVSGCGLGINTAPQLSLADIGMERFGFLEQGLSLSLRVQNPNGYSMEIHGLSCTLDIDGQRFAQGVSAQQVRVPAYGDTIMKVSVSAGTGSVLRQLQALAQGGRDAIDYRLQGQAEVSGLGQVPFDQRGDIPLPSLLGQPSQAPSRRSF